MKLNPFNFSDERSFALSGGRVRVTDPCYDTDVWCSGFIEPVLRGEWLARVSYHADKEELETSLGWLTKHRDDSLARITDEHHRQMIEDEYQRRVKEMQEYRGRVNLIAIRHSSVESKLTDTLEGFERVEDLHVGVDSGQAGFFEHAAYEEALKQKPLNDLRHTAFYESIMELTLESGDEWGVLPWGAVSCTGYGDGGYNCYVRKNDEGKIVEAVIVYIVEDYDEDDYEGEGDEAETEDA